MTIKKTLKNYQNKSVIPAKMIERTYIFLYIKVPKTLLSVRHVNINQKKPSNSLQLEITRNLSKKLMKFKKVTKISEQPQ